MATLKNIVLFMGGFLNVGVLLTLVLVVVLVLSARRRGDRQHESYLSDDHTRKIDPDDTRDGSGTKGKHR